jgi:hypothetical protein
VLRTVYLFTALLISFYWLQDPASSVLGRAEGELRDHLWVAYLVQERLKNLELPVFFPEANWPLGIKLYPLDPLFQLLVFILLPVGFFPAFWLISMLGLVMTGWGVERLALALGSGKRGAVLAGVVGMLGPPILGFYVDTQSEGFGCGLGAHALASVLGPKPVWAGFWLALLLLSSPYQAHALAGVVVGWALWRGWRVGLGVLGASGPVALLVGAALLWAEGEEGGTGQGGQLMVRAKPGDWPPLVASRLEVVPEASPADPMFFQEVHEWEHTPERAPPVTGPRRWSGLLLPLLVLEAWVLAWRQKRWAVLVILAFSVGYGSLSLGSGREFLKRDIMLPFDAWYRWAPLGKLAWKPQVYAVPAWWLAVGATAAILPEGALLLVLLEVETMGPTRGFLPVIKLKEQPWQRVLQEKKGGVVEFPSRGCSREGVDRMPADVLLGPIFHHRPLGETFRRGRNPAYEDFSSALGRAAGWRVPPGPPLSIALEQIRESGFTALILHTRLLTEKERESLIAEFPVYQDFGGQVLIEF